MSDTTITDDPSRFRTTVYATVGTIFAAMVLGATLEAQPLRSANERSRWATVYSLVELGTWQIDAIDANPSWTTIDKVRHEGHFYSTKPPLLPRLVAWVYAGLRRATGWNILNRPKEVTQSILVLINLLPWLFAVQLLGRMLERHTSNVGARIFVLITACFGTLLTPFLTTFNNHTVAATSLLIALAASVRIKCDGRSSGWLYAAAGLFSAFTTTCELPAALFGIAIFLLLAIHDLKRTLLWFVPAALVPLVAFFVLNYQVTGGWKPFYTYYGTEKYLFVVDGVPSYWMNPQGLDKNVEPPATYLFHCLVGHHGILSLSPVFVLTVVSWFYTFRARSPLRPFVLMGAVLSLTILGFYLTRTQNYNYGGNSSALRWMLWLIPFWLIGMVPLVDALWNRRTFRALAMLLLLFSAHSVQRALPNPWAHPWLYTLMEQNGLIDYRSAPAAFERPHASWIQSLPDDSQLPCLAEFERSELGDQVSRFRLSCRPADDAGYVIVRWQQLGSSMPIREWTLNRDKFNAGASPESALVWPDQRSRNETLTSSLEFFQGMPAFREYRPGSTRFIKTPAREDAFRCQFAASRVGRRRGDSVRWHRCDVAWSKDLPFGVVRVSHTVTAGRELLRKEQYDLVRFEVGSAR